MNDAIVMHIHQAARWEYPNEACGVVVSIGKKPIALSCRNLARNPKDQFVMSPEDYAMAASQGEILAIWHTHVECDPVASDADKIGCENTQLPWYIVSVYMKDDGEFHFSDLNFIEPTGYELDYVGRPYVWGVIDCFTILRDYYRKEFGIHINDYPREEPNGKTGHHYFIDAFEFEGFVLLDAHAPYKKGDLIFMQIQGMEPNHCAIYIGDDKILHHCVNRLSKVDIYGGYWEKHTTHRLRHKNHV